MPKQLLYGDQARSAILQGVNQLANAVKATWVQRAETLFWIRNSAHPRSPKTA